MHLKKLELVGFKSFADRTSLDFKPGITGIVGPNGCGKSNVVDAFKWILGSQSAKGLRGTEMMDVIFGGTQNRKPLGYAEVTVVFDNTDHYFELDFTEVAITRRLFRSGESEYLINKQRCRLKDIKSLFLDTGFGATSYSILEQGKIDVLLQATNSDRRVVFEEAAGISKYRVRKAESLRALLRVEDNLDRLQDLIDEVAKRVRRVKTQASKARRYRAYAERIKELRVRIALDAYKGSMDEGSRLSSSLDNVLGRISGLEDELSSLAASIESKRSEREQLRKKLQESRDQVEAERIARERTSEKIDQADKRFIELVEEEGARKRELAQTAGSLRVTESQVEGEREKLGGLDSEVERCGASLSEAKEELKILRDRQAETQGLLDTRKEGLVEGLQERAATYNHLVQTVADLKALEKRKTHFDGVIARQKEALERCSAGGRGLDKKTDESNVNLGQVESEREKVSHAMGKFEVRIEEREEKLRERRDGLNREASRFEALNSLQDSSAVFSRRSGEFDSFAQVHGQVGSVISAEEAYARALDTTLGKMRHAVVVEGQEGALELLGHVRREDGESAGIIALDRIEAPGVHALPGAEGVIGPLRDFVEVQPGFEEVADRLLANVVLVDDIAAAFSLSRNGAGNCRLVTLAGELLEPWGGLAVPGERTGGAADAAELDRLSRSVRARQEECDELARSVEELRRKLGQLRLALKSKDRSSDDARRRVLVCEGEVGQAAREVEKLERELGVSVHEREEVLKEISRKTAIESDYSSEVARLDSECAEAETLVERLAKELESMTVRTEAGKELVSEARLAMGKVENETGNLREFFERQVRNLEDQEARCESLRESIRLGQERLRRTRREQVDSRALLLELGERETGMAEQFKNLEQLEQALSRGEDEIRKQCDGVRSKISEYSEQKQSLHLKDQDERHRRDSALDRIEEEYGLDLKSLVENAGDWAEVEESAAESAGAAPVDEPGEISDEERFLKPIPGWDCDAAQEELDDVLGKMRRLGNVNLEALDELEELEERYKFQMEQKTDLEDAANKLHAIIAELNAKCRQLFQETFDSVQKNFKELFRKCFGGGRAELVLEEGMDILEAGIDIVARPPGKKLRTLALMSGGEKTMTTIALLLAIFKSKPSPFCILDEVDAPLDDANVGRFTVLLDDFLKNTQFIIITHNKVTMGYADTLYGITMQERGVSKQVSVSLESYDPDKMEAMAASNSA